MLYNVRTWRRMPATAVNFYFMYISLSHPTSLSTPFIAPNTIPQHININCWKSKYILKSVRLHKNKIRATENEVDNEAKNDKISQEEKLYMKHKKYKNCSAYPSHTTQQSSSCETLPPTFLWQHAEQYIFLLFCVYANCFYQHIYINCVENSDTTNNTQSSSQLSTPETIQSQKRGNECL